MKTLLVVALALAIPATAVAKPELNTPTSIVYGEATSSEGGPAAFTVSAYHTSGQDPPRRTPAPFTCTWDGTSVSGKGEATFPNSEFPNVFFALDRLTEVTCTMGDSEEPLVKTFNVKVLDTTAPTIRQVPDSIVVAATEPGGNRLTYALPTATDLVDGPVAVKCTPPSGSLFKIGSTIVSCVSVDARANEASKSFTVTVTSPPPPPPAPAPPPPPAPAPPADTTPPGEVVALTIGVRATSVLLSWTLPSDTDFGGVEIVRRTAGGPAETLYSGTATSFVDRAVRARTTYTYVVAAIDAAGNRSGGISRTVTTRAALIAPSTGARLVAPPVLRWTPIPATSYYNVQLWRSGKKILSAWPTAPRFALRASWIYVGKRYRLSPGTYRWYVWPGRGARAAGNYGRVVGTRTFVIRG